MVSSSSKFVRTATLLSLIYFLLEKYKSEKKTKINEITTLKTAN